MAGTVQNTINTILNADNARHPVREDSDGYMTWEDLARQMKASAALWDAALRASELQPQRYKYSAKGV